MENAVFKPLLDHPNAQHLIGLYKQTGYDLRFVGGCVRDCLSGVPIGDIDMATTATPLQGQELLKAADVKTVPTGIDHGTITAVVDGQPFEITTLRRDVATDGRRATASYTDSWEEDAARRDFTINAMSLSGDGVLYDPFDGQVDLNAGRVRFIGDAAERIREDALRILRFFRFNAHIGEGAMEAEGLKACVENASLLATLSKERVRAEVFKLLKGKNIVPIWRKLVEISINQYFLKKSNNINSLNKVFNVKHSLNALYLSLFETQDRDADVFQAALKLSNKETRAMADTIKAYAADWQSLPALLYHYGEQAVSDAALLRYGDGVIEKAEMEMVLSTATAWQKPKFPVTGADLVKSGYKQGAELGEALKRLEQYWIENDFKPTREECLERS